MVSTNIMRMSYSEHSFFLFSEFSEAAWSTLSSGDQRDQTCLAK
jgi:hypothetical protein